MKDSPTGAAGDGNKAWNSGSQLLVRRVMQLSMFLVGFAVLWMLLYNSSSPFGFSTFSNDFVDQSSKDTDIMWLRDPFNQFYEDADFQIACDYFNGNSEDLKNLPNGGFNYVKSNSKTQWFYKFWFNSRKAYPRLHDQDVLNNIKMNPLISDMKLKIRFLSTSYFGGFCQVSKDFNKVSTMHANCCVGLENKVNDLKILLEDWKKYMALSENERKQAHPSWSVPQNCSTSFQRAKQRRKKPVTL